MKFSIGATLAAATLFTHVAAVLPQLQGLPSRPLHLNIIPPPEIHTAAAPYQQGEFQQYIDHNNQSLGTFPQAFWYSTQYCAAAGCPVVLFTPGEANASAYTGYLTNTTITGQFAQAIGGAVILLEHRFWGTSLPYPELTADKLQVHTLENAILDLTNFANTVKLPFDPEGKSNAKNAPWVLSGGSYSGALSAWTASLHPGTFWAYHSSSAPVETIYDFWQMFESVQDGMAKNCSSDVFKVIDHIDQVFESGTKTDNSNLKKMFGLEGLENDDFGAALENALWLWQSNTFTSNAGFFDFCDAVENVGKYAPEGSSGTVPDANGVGLEKALNGYANWFKTGFLPGWCAGYGYAEWQDPMSIDCFNTHNATSPMYTDTTVSNTWIRAWQWLLCNEPFGYWQTAAPKGTPSLISRAVTADYWQNQCQLFFPPVNGYTFDPKHQTEDDVNKRTGGWDLTNTTRLIWANGQYDPWRNSGTSSKFRPGGPLESTPQAPLNIIPSGYHCSDLRMSNANANKGVMDVVQKEIAQIATWVKEWPGTYGH